MIYNKLPNTDIKVSKICLGTMTFGEQNTKEEAFEQLDYALDAGVNFIDTAEIYAVPTRKETYGATENIIGQWIKERNNRDKYVLATKVAGPSEYLSTYIRDDLGFSKRAILEAIDKSLSRLQTDYIDIYQLHWPQRKTNRFGVRYYAHDEEWDDDLEETIFILEDLKKAGKIRHYGISNETPWGTMRHLSICDSHKVQRPVSIQNPYSLLNRTYEYGMSEVSIRENIGLIAYSPLAMGLLSGKYNNGKANADSRLHKFKAWPRYRHANSMIASGEYLQLAEEHNLSLTHMALAFINSRPFVSSNIIGATTMAQLKENISSVDVDLSEDVLKGIEKIQATYPNPAP